MGFPTMNVSLKNNKRPRVSVIDKLEKYNFKEEGKLYFKNKATKNELEFIKVQAKTDAKEEVLINYIVFSLVFISAMFLTGIIIF
ncbi:hypothetical protein [Tenacibaculum sp. M341]|uniref:hypothetical protein n=1 Tax=Tenacibaculum sp. M341 TaxID=2530339 RepID=UPI00104DFA25|nr:hypothetical protein [Tenacibaculum sp. M341]TCI93658.1 hypothetical protein EYW44_04390 [Tenacibaculum sp. M341]